MPAVDVDDGEEEEEGGGECCWAWGRARAWPWDRVGWLNVELDGCDV